MEWWKRINSQLNAIFLSFKLLHLDLWQSRMFQLWKRCDCKTHQCKWTEAPSRRWKPEYEDYEIIYTLPTANTGSLAGVSFRSGVLDQDMVGHGV